jgi:hypothetical protein
MNSEQAKQILIENYLLSIGITPVKQSGHNLWYKIAFQKRKKSFLQSEPQYQPMARFRERRERQHH